MRRTNIVCAVVLVLLQFSNNACFALTPALAFAAADAAQAQAQKAQRTAAESKTRAQAVRSRLTKDDALSEKERLAIAALQALLSAPPERALPKIEMVLNSQHSEHVKKRAIFVLGQVDLPNARSLLFKYAQAQAPKALRTEAIRTLGICGHPESIKYIQSLYSGSDKEIKQAIVQAMIIANAKSELLALAVATQDASEQEHVINALAAMGAKAELRSLAERGTKPESLISALGISGDLDTLEKFARRESDVGLRTRAIQSIGIVGGKRAGEILVDLYRAEPNPKVREAVLNGLLIMGAENALLEIYRSSSSTDDKSRVLKLLSAMGGDAALEAIDAALDGKSP